MSMNLELKKTTFGSSVSFLDSQQTRSVRGGITLDHSDVVADANGIKKLKAGTFIGKKANGKWAKYVAATKAKLTTGTEAGNDGIAYEAVQAGEDGNDITIAYANPGTASSALAVTVVGKAITVSLETNAAVKATGATGDEADSNGITWTAKDYGGNEIVIVLKDPGDTEQQLSVAVAGKTVIINLATDATGDIVSTAADVIAAIEVSDDASALVTVANTGNSDGSGVVTAEVIQLAGGEELTVVSTAAEVIAAIKASADVSALVAVDDLGDSTGAGVVAEMAATPLSGGADANVTPTLLLKDDVMFTTYTSSGGVTHGDQVASAYDMARVITSRLPEAPDAVVKANMPGITFVS